MRELGGVCPGEGRIRRDLMALYNYVKGNCSQTGVSLLQETSKRKWPQIAPEEVWIGD